MHALLFICFACYSIDKFLYQFFFFCSNVWCVNSKVYDNWNLQTMYKTWIQCYYTIWWKGPMRNVSYHGILIFAKCLKTMTKQGWTYMYQKCTSACIKLSVFYSIGSSWCSCPLQPCQQWGSVFRNYGKPSKSPDSASWR